MTGCYRSANSAVRALQQWAANPDAPLPPAPWQCESTTMQAVLCENVPNAPAMPLGTTESIYRPSVPTPPADLCGNNHAVLLRYWASNDLAPTPCPKCGKEATYIHLGMSVDPRSDDLRGLPRTGRTTVDRRELRAGRTRRCPHTGGTQRRPVHPRQLRARL